MAPSGQAAVVQCSTTLRRRALQRPYCWVVQQLPVLLDASRGTAYGERWSISLTLHLTRGSSTVDLAPPGWLCMLTTRHCMTPLNTWRLIVEPHSMQHSRHLWSAVLMQCCAHCWGLTVTTTLQPVCSACPFCSALPLVLPGRQSGLSACPLYAHVETSVQCSSPSLTVNCCAPICLLNLQVRFMQDGPSVPHNMGPL